MPIVNYMRMRKNTYPIVLETKSRQGFTTNLFKYKCYYKTDLS